MTPELENKLYQRFPNLFIERNLPMTQTCMCWGIETGDGWFSLIWELCEKLETLSKDLVFTQIKEKFGRLSVHYRYTKNKRFLRGLKAREKRKVKRKYKVIDWLISQTEYQSMKICEVCGEKGELSSSHRRSVLCERCDGK